MKSALQLSGFALIGVLVLSACSSPKSITLDDEFSPTNQNPQEVLDRVNAPVTPIVALSGRARAQYSGPGSSDRSTMAFTSDRERSLFIFRNNLGIEGARLLVEPDSVTLYNRIDQTAQIFGTQNRDIILDYGFYAVNLLGILNPDVVDRAPRRVLENETSWLLIFDDQTRMVFDKSSGHLMRLEFASQSAVDFSTYLFANHTEHRGYWLPRNIQILSTDQKSSIFLNIQSYEIDPAMLNFTLDIPSHVRIDRQ